MFFFFAQHWTLVLLPFYFVFSGKFVVLSSTVLFTLFSFSLHALWHALVLSPASLIKGKNLNYMMNPPRGHARLLGRAYRPVIFTACLFFCFLTRYAFAAPISHLIRSFSPY